MTQDETPRESSDSISGNSPDRSERAFSGEKARQGRIILNTPRRKAIFIAGLVGIVLLALLSGLSW